MKNYGFIRVAAAVNSSRTADIFYNTLKAKTSINEAVEKGISLLTFSELYLTGCTCGDLFGHRLLIEQAEKSVNEIALESKDKNIAIVIGTPVAHRGRLYNCAVVIKDGKIAGLVPKTYISAAESRWFTSGIECMREGKSAEIIFAGQKCRMSPNLLFELDDCTFAVEFGNDSTAPVSPAGYHTVAGAQIIVNPSADNEIIYRNDSRNRLLSQQSYQTLSAYIYASAKGESTQDTVYAGAGSIWELGCKMSECERFAPEDQLIAADIDIERINAMRMKSSTFYAVSPDGTVSSSFQSRYETICLGASAETDFDKDLIRYIEPHPFAPAEGIEKRCQEILDIQVEALTRRLAKIGSKAVIGISGGLDSTLALLVTALAFDKLNASSENAKWARENIITVTMPGFGTTSRTKNNAWDLMEALGTTCREIPIGAAVEQHFKDIGHDSSIHDATYENSQARERTQILMDIANQTGGIVVGTGDLSELALGWATYNGDHMSMYGINAGVPKTLVRSLVKWAAENRFDKESDINGRSIKDILLDIVDTPISPELLPANKNDEIQQVTEDLVGPYELHDFFIFNFVRFGYSPEKIFFLAKHALPSYSDETIKKWLKTFVRRFFNQQFKRSCMPDGPKIGSVSLSPRGDWSMPSDAWDTIFQNE